MKLRDIKVSRKTKRQGFHCVGEFTPHLNGDPPSLERDSDEFSDIDESLGPVAIEVPEGASGPVVEPKISGEGFREPDTEHNRYLDKDQSIFEV